MSESAAPEEITAYQRDGFVVIPSVLSADDVSHWRAILDAAWERRGPYQLPGQRWPLDGTPALYASRVLTKRVNLYQDNEDVRSLVTDARIGNVAAGLSGVQTLRLWADQYLTKDPYAPPTGFHLDCPAWSFHDRDALTIWIALDDVTERNGCMCYIPGVHRQAGFKQFDLKGEIGGIFAEHPEWASIEPVFCPVKAGDAIFHNGLTPHGACANMTPLVRHAMTAIYYPDGATFNGIQNVLSAEQMAALEVGDLLNDDTLNPVVADSG